MHGDLRPRPVPALRGAHRSDLEKPLHADRREGAGRPAADPHLLPAPRLGLPDLARRAPLSRPLPAARPRAALAPRERRDAPEPRRLRRQRLGRPAADLPRPRRNADTLPGYVLLDDGL